MEVISDSSVTTLTTLWGLRHLTSMRRVPWNEARWRSRFYGIITKGGQMNLKKGGDMHT